jgi:GNAT superfamily N-acetyltransferase
MSGTEVAPTIHVRPYDQADEPAVLDLLTAALGGGPSGSRSPEFFRWKHLENPFGRSLLLVAETEGKVVGLRAFMRWRFVSGEGSVRAARAVDTVTHPDHQGKGIFSKLTREAVELLRSDTDLIFNTPNGQSGPGYLKMGWRAVGQMPIRIRVRRPIGFAKGLGSARSIEARPSRGIDVQAPLAADLLDESIVRPLLEDAATTDDRFSTPMSAEYLLWRYARSPLEYRAIALDSGSGVRGVAIFRVRPRGTLWEASVSDLLVRRGDDAAMRTLLDRVCAAAAIDHATCHFPERSPASTAARSRRFFRSPRGGLFFTVNPLSPQLDRAADIDAWALSLGTLEVF